MPPTQASVSAPSAQPTQESSAAPTQQAQQATQAQPVQPTQTTQAQPTFELNDEVVLRDEQGNNVKGFVTAVNPYDGTVDFEMESPFNGKRAPLMTFEEAAQALVPAGEVRVEEAAQSTERATQVPMHERPLSKTLAELHDGSLNQEEINEFVAANIAEAQAELDALQPSKPKMTTDKAAYIEQKKEWQAKVDKAAARFAYWQQAQEEEQKRSTKGDAVGETLNSASEAGSAVQTEAELEEAGKGKTAESVNGVTEISNDERSDMEDRIVNWLSEENLSRAAGKTRNEIFEEFGNDLMPIAYIPTKYVSLLSPDLKDPRIYCGKGYFIDHALRNHAKEGAQVSADEVDVSKYLNIQSVLDNPDHVKETYVDGKRTVVFIKKIGRFFAELTQMEEDGKIVLHKSLFNQKKEPYAKLNDIRSIGTSSEGGDSSISHADSSAPAISLQSRGDVISSETNNPHGSGVSESKSTEKTDSRNSLGEKNAAEAEEARRAPLRARAMEWSKKLGVPVRIVESLDEVTNAAARREIMAVEKKGGLVKGWYEHGENGDEVVFYMPHLQDEKDIDLTYLHEVVAHKGLQDMLGREQFGELCDRVWNMMSEAARKKYLAYPGVNGDTRKAADEYMAHLAEGIGLDEYERTIWNAIVEFVKKVLAAAGAEISEADVEMLIRASYANLKKAAAEKRESQSPRLSEEKTDSRNNSGKKNKQATDAKSEKDRQFEIYMRELNAMDERQRNRGVPPVPGLLAEAYGANDQAAIQEWEKRWETYLQSLVVMDLPVIESTTRNVKEQGRIKGKDGKIDKQNPIHQALNYIAETLKKRAAALKKQATAEELEAVDIFNKAIKGEIQFRVEEDTEKAARIAKLRTAKDAIIEGNEFEITGDPKVDKKNALEYGKKLQGSYTNADTGNSIQLQRGRKNGGVKEVLQHNYKDIPHLQSVAAIPQIIENSIFIDEVENYDKDKNPNVESYQHYVCGMKIGDVDYTVHSIVAVDQNGDRYYDHNLTQVEKRKLLDIATSQAVEGNGFGTTPDTKSTTNSERKYNELLNLLQIESGKNEGDNDYSSTKFRAVEAHKQKQLEIINATNPAQNDINTWVRGVDGIYTFEEALQESDYADYQGEDFDPSYTWDMAEQALKTGEITVYSSYPIENGVFVTPSYLEAQSYGGTTPYEAKVKLEDVAWIDPTQGQLATDNDVEYERARGGVRFRVANENQEVFVSNAAKAVEAVKQDKATPAQWLAMLQKQGGLKAGEDRWLGLSDWLNGSNAKTLTKQDVLGFINDNKIRIEEVEYGETSSDFEGLKEEYENLLRAEGYDAAHDIMTDRYGDDFDMAFSDMGGELVIEDEDAAASILGSGSLINRTRLEYTTEGLEDKREIALTVPTIEPYNTSDAIHFGDAGEGRAVAWVRFGETTDNEGKRVLVIDEIQSKRHQDGRDRGYKDSKLAALDKMLEEMPRSTEADIEERRRVAGERYNYLIKQIGGDAVLLDEELGTLQQRAKELGDEIKNEPEEKVQIAKLNIELDGVRNVRDFDRISNEIKEIEDRMNQRRNEFDEVSKRMREVSQRIDDMINEYVRTQRNRVDEAPFEKNWHELAMKRMLRLASEEGFDKVAWTTGAQQAERYDMHNVLDRIQVQKFSDGYSVTAYDGEYHKVSDGLYPDAAALANVYGKELAQKIVESADANTSRNAVTISGDGLKIGGEGMKGFYDKMLPSFVQKYVKKWGAKVGEVYLPNLEEDAQHMWSVDVTDQMKKDVMEGQLMFRSVEVVQERGHDAQSAETIAKEFGLRPSSMAEFVSSREDIEALKNIVAEGMYDKILSAYDDKCTGISFPNIGVVLIFKEHCDNNLEEQLAWWHEQTHCAYDGISLPDKMSLGYEALDWVAENDEDKYNVILNRYAPYQRLEEATSVFIEGLIDRYGTSKFMESDFAELGELAILADAIRNTIKNGKEDTERKIEAGYRFGQPNTQSVSGANHSGKESSVLQQGYDGGGNSVDKEAGRVPSQEAGTEIDDFATETSFRVVGEPIPWHERTYGIWEVLPLSDVPQRAPDYVSTNFYGKESSKYWYGEDEGGKYVVRASDHWSRDILGKYADRVADEFMNNEVYRESSTGRIRGSRWALDYRGVGGKDLDLAKMGREAKTEFLNGFKNEAGETYAKVYLSDLKRTSPEERLVEKRTVEDAKNVGVDDLKLVDAFHLEGARAKTKGFVDNDGTIVVVKDYHILPAGTEATLLREATSKNGLRSMFGDAYTAFLDTVFAAMPQEVRKDIAKMSASHQRDVRMATEEYLSDMAPGEDNMKWWDTAKSLFVDMLHKVGFEHVYPTNLPDNVLRYILWRNYRNHAEPYGKRSIMGMAEDVVMRERLKVDETVDSSTLFRVDEAAAIETANARFNAELDDFKAKTHQGLLHLGAPMSVLSAAGVNAEELTISPSVLHQHLKKHKLTTDDLKGLAAAVQTPILVYRHGEKFPNFAIVTELDVQGGKLAIALKLDENGDVVEVSNVSSVHSKDGLTEIERLSELGESKLKDYLRWVEKEKVSDWLGLPYEEERQEPNPKLVSVANVIDSFENPNISDEISFRVTADPLRREYDDAVRRPNGRSNVGAFDNLAHRLREGYQDSMLSLKKLQEIIEGHTGSPLQSNEDAYTFENALSSRNKIEHEVYEREFFVPMMNEVTALMKKHGLDYFDVTDYLYAKHGLERNIYYSKKSAEKSGEAWDGKVKDYSGLTDLTGDKGMKLNWVGRTWAYKGRIWAFAR